MYKLTQYPNCIVRLSDGATIPKGINGDWQIYEAWLAKGDTPTAFEVKISPRIIDARRLRLALLELDLLSVVEALIATTDKSTQIEWEYATEIREDYPLAVQLASTLNLDIKAIFDKAQSISSV